MAKMHCNQLLMDSATTPLISMHLCRNVTPILSFSANNKKGMKHNNYFSVS